MCRHKHTPTALQVVAEWWQSPHRSTLSATVAPFEEWKTTNLRYRISPCYYTLAVLFLPFFHNIPWVWCSYTLAELTKKSLHILVWFSSAVIYSKKNRYLPQYWILTRLTKRSKGRCTKSVPPHMLALGTILFPQASGTNAGGSALGNDPSYGAKKSRACIHIALLAPFKTGKPCLSRAILDLLCIYWLLALLPRTISPPKMWVIFSNEHLLTKSRKKTLKKQQWGLNPGLNCLCSVPFTHLRGSWNLPFYILPSAPVPLHCH